MLADDEVKQRRAFEDGLTGEEYADQRDSEVYIPARFERIVRLTLDLKNDIEFGYAVSRSEMTYSELLGSRACQRARNAIDADREVARQEKDKINNPTQ